MKTALKALLFILFLVTFTTKAQEVEWDKKFNGQGAQIIRSIEIDDDGNIYLMGGTGSQTTDIDPGPGVFNLTHDQVDYWLSYYTDVFLVKLDSSGNFLWGKGIYTKFDQNNSPFSMKLGPDGFIYVTTLMQEDQFYHRSIIINKFDTSGNLILTKSLNNHLDNQGFIDATNLDIDTNGDMFVSGIFLNTIVLDPQNPQFNFNYTANGSFIIKLNEQGEIGWTKIFTGNESAHDYSKVLVRADHNLIFLLGHFVQNQTQTGFDPVQTLYKIDGANGDIIWDKVFLNQDPNDFTLAPNGEIVITSDFANVVIDVDPSAGTHMLTPLETYENQYILWLSAEGEFMHVIPYFFEWSNFLAPTVEIDENYNCYFNVGMDDVYGGTYDADPGEGEFLIYGSYGSYRPAVIKFDSNYMFETAYNFESLASFNICQTEYHDNKLYFVGGYGFTTDIQPGPGEYLLEQSEFGTTYDGYLFALTDCALTAPQGNADQYFCTNVNATIANLSPNNAGIVWYDSATSTTPLVSTTALVDGQVYYASRTSTCGVPARLAVTAHIVPTPTPPVAVNQQFCTSVNPTTANLTATGQNLKWYADITSTTPLNVSVILTAGNYYVTQTINECESTKTVITVTLIETPLVTAPDTQSFCSNVNATISNLNITGTDIKVYDSESATTPIAATTPLQSIIYYATQTLNGCESIRTAITVTIHNTPAPIANGTQIFCAGDSPTLNNIIVTGSNIKWYDAPTGGNLLAANMSLINNTAYYASQTMNNCESTARALVTVTVDSANIPATSYETYFCEEQTVNLNTYNSNILATTAGYSFSYYNSQAGAENKTVTDLVANPENVQINAGTTLVYVRIDSAGGCFKVVSLKLTLAVNPELLPVTDYYMCQANGVTIMPNSGFSNFKWSTGATTTALHVNQPGNYWVTAGYDNGNIICYTQINFIVHALPSTQITDLLVTDWTDADNSITVITSTGNDNEYSIDGVHYQQDNQFSNLLPGIYTVHARDVNGCGHDTREVIILNYPKFFTPNNDGVNDYWKIDYSYFEDNLEVMIFDRYGKLITGLKKDSQGWNGTFNEKPMPSTDYWFVVRRANGKEYKGHFSLLR